MKLFSAQKDLLRSASQKGFTLIELLVVIGILGILAAALVATIDPFEQLKKANDSNTKNAMVEYLNANVRYYTTHSEFPWDNTANTACYAGGAAVDEVALDSARMITGTDSCVGALIEENELKQAFDTSSILENIYITYNAGANEIVGCFEPQSKSQQSDPNTNFNRDGSDGDPQTKDCESTAANNGCYWCTR